MTLLALFKRYGADLEARALLAAVAGGLLSAAIVAVANAVLARDGNVGSLSLGLMFLLALAVMFVCNRWSARMTIKSFEDVQRALRAELAAGLRAAPLRTIEELGARCGRLTGDLVFISNSITHLVFMVQNTAFLVGMTVIIATVSGKALLIWLVTCAVIAWWLLPRLQRLNKMQGSISTDRSELQARIEDLLDGFKQAKLDARVGDTLVADICAGSAALYGAQTQIGVATSKTSLVSTTLFFTLGFGVAVFAPESTIGLGPTLGYEMSVLLALSIGPLIGLFHALPVMSKVEASSAAVVEVLDQLREDRSDAPHQGSGEFEAIDLVGLVFAYGAHRDAEAPGFVVGPIDLRLRPGELTFVTGGNGSGKTTLMKMLLGLYPPHSGVIRWDGRDVNSDSVTHYRELFTAIFSGQHLFERLYGLHAPREEVEALLERFGIADIVHFDGVRFGHMDLSSGQRMRLAMVVALLEKRPICVFDEWTANQDPETTWFYYDTLLPELIAAGKAVVAVSHDDRFFDRADHLVRLEKGKMARGRSEGGAAGQGGAEPRPS
jgi:putative ATP-binding cassette transporter